MVFCHSSPRKEIHGKSRLGQNEGKFWIWTKVPVSNSLWWGCWRTFGLEVARKPPSEMLRRLLSSHSTHGESKRMDASRGQRSLWQKSSTSRCALRKAHVYGLFIFLKMYVRHNRIDTGVSVCSWRSMYTYNKPISCLPVCMLMCVQGEREHARVSVWEKEVLFIQRLLSLTDRNKTS